MGVEQFHTLFFFIFIFVAFSFEGQLIGARFARVLMRRIEVKSFALPCVRVRVRVRVFLWPKEEQGKLRADRYFICIL